MLFQRLNWMFNEALKGPVVWEMFYLPCFYFLPPTRVQWWNVGHSLFGTPVAGGGFLESSHVKSVLADIPGCLLLSTQIDTQSV